MTLLRTSNVRLGFATNSSSTHSIVVLGKGDKKLESRPAEGWYGWEPFVLTDRGDKLDYLAWQLYFSLVEDVGHAVAVAVAHEWLGYEGDFSEGCIDHQSQLFFPHARERLEGPCWGERRGVCHEFILDFKEFLLREEVIVLGGSDNSDDPPGWNFPDRRYTEYLFSPNTEGQLVVLKIGPDWWTVINTKTGAKVRLSFAKDPTPLLRSRVPELVDMKITDKCYQGCQFCYQDSKPNGEHADSDVVGGFLWKLGELGTLEVAFGGGEPTKHPDLPKFLNEVRRYGIIPNFSTATLFWSEALVAAAQEYLGAFALSVEKATDVGRLYEFCRQTGLYGTAQFVVGAHPPERLFEVARAARDLRITLTLLGFKRVGRGASFEPIEQGEWVEPLLEIGPRLSVDTSIVAQYGERLVEEGVSDKLMVGSEGCFSMYIDAVARKAAVSSYHPNLVDCQPRDVGDVWQKLGG